MVSLWLAPGPAFSRRDELLGQVVVCFDFLADRRVVDTLAEPIDRGKAAQAVVRPLPVVEVLPLCKEPVQLGIVEVHRRPEFLERGLLDPLDLAVEMR